jgi:hypothetical protein
VFRCQLEDEDFAPREPGGLAIRFCIKLTLPDASDKMNSELFTKDKSLVFSDRQVAYLTGTTEDAIRARRKKLGLVPSDHLVGRHAAGFKADTRRSIRPAAACAASGELRPSL